MKTTFLEYYKTILEKVSFDRNLFTKEYRKATRQLNANEVDDLNRWLATRNIRHAVAGSSARKIELSPRRQLSGL